MEEYKKMLKNMFRFEGRARRREYWVVSNGYEGSAGIVVSIILMLVGTVLLIASISFNVAKCGLKENPRMKNIDYVEMVEENKAFNGCTITIGSSELTLIVPAGAEDVYCGDNMLIYDDQGLHVEYSDSFCGVEEDALSQLRDKYDMQASDDDLDISACVEPVETEVGKRDVFYYTLVNTDGKDFNYSYYTFFVDIGADDYLEVIVHGMTDDFLKADASEIVSRLLDKMHKVW